jgi:vacuolar-type H+-ATPase subunit H
MDMAFLIDRLEAHVNAGRRVPFGRLMVDEQELLDIIDQMRISLPNEVTQARRILQEREQIISQAQGEAEKIVTMARDRAAYMLDDSGLMQEAKSHAEQMLADARAESESLRTEVNAYAAEMLTKLEDLLDKNLAQVRRGIEHLT